MIEVEITTTEESDLKVIKELAEKCGGEYLGVEVKEVPFYTEKYRVSEDALSEKGMKLFKEGKW